MTDKKFAVIGGDQRFRLLCSLLAEDGYSVFAAGLGDIDEIPGVTPVGYREAAELSDCIVLPLPATADGSTLWTPLASRPILLDDAFGEMIKSKLVFAGRVGRMKEVYPTGLFLDYFASEPFQVKNAQATAEGALAEAIINMPETIRGTKCLVCGWGRIGKLIAPMLRSIGGEVTVAARSEIDRAWAQSLSLQTIDFSNLSKDISDFRLIINTIPSVMFSRKVLCHVSKSATLIDLSSQPGGVDFDAAKALGIRSVHALSLPGKYSPLTAARIIKDTILEIEV